MVKGKPRVKFPRGDPEDEHARDTYHPSGSGRNSSSPRESDNEENEDEGEEYWNEELGRVLAESREPPTNSIQRQHGGTAHSPHGTVQSSTRFVSASGLTGWKKRPTDHEGATSRKKQRMNGRERYGPNRKPTVSPITPKSLRKKILPTGGGGGDGDSDSSSSDDDNYNNDNSGGGAGRCDQPPRRSSSPKSSSSTQKSTSSSGSSAFGPAPRPLSSFYPGWKAWPEPVPLWYELPRNSDTQNNKEEESDEDLAGLNIEEIAAELSVKKARKKRHIPNNFRTENANEANSSGRRSSTPSPSTSLARAEVIRRSSAALPITPAVDLSEPVNEEGLKGDLLQPPSPGLLGNRVGSVKTTHAGTSRDRASAFAPGARKADSRTRSQSSQGSHQPLQASSKRKSSSPGSSDIPLVQRPRTRAEARKKREEAGMSRREAFREEKKAKERPRKVFVVDDEWDEEDKEKAEKSKERGEKVASEEVNKDEEEQDEPEPPHPKRGKAAKKAAKPPAKKSASKTGTQRKKRMTEAERL